MDKQNAINIINDNKNKQIDVKKTIENGITGDFLGLINYYVAPIKDEKYIPKTVPELMGMSYDDYADSLDDAFYEKVDECLNDEGIYIALAYAIDPAFATSPGDCEVIEYDCDENTEFESNYITCGNKHVELRTPYDSVITSMTSDYGIKVKKIGESFEVKFGSRGEGPTAMHPPSFDEFEIEGEEYGFVSLNNPLNQLIVELMKELIVFK